MRLWVGRHGFAGPYCPDDSKKERERALQPKGVATVKAVVQAMIDADEIPNTIFCSPFIRATQTADIIGSTLGISVNVVGDLSPDRPLEDRILELMSHKEVKRLMLVGHHDNEEPAFEAFGGDFDRIAMGEVRRLKIDRKTGEWSEKWRVRPSDLGFPDLFGGET